MNYLRQLLGLLSNKEKRKLILVFIGVLLLGILELAGIGSIMPFLSVASNPEMIQTNVYLKRAYEIFRFTSSESFLFTLGIGAILFIVFSNAMKALVTYMNKRFTAMRLHSLSLRLFRRYLYRPYVFFLNKNTSELMKNILTEVSDLVNNALKPLLDITTSVVVTLLIVVMLVLVNPVLALIAFTVVCAIYGIVYLTVRRRLDHLGKRSIESHRLRYKKISEAFGGIKDLKVLGREDYYIRDFIPPSIENAKVNVTMTLIGDIPRYVLEIVAFGGMLLVVLYMMRTMGNFRDAVPVIGLYAFAAYRMIPSLQKFFSELSKLRSHLPVAKLIRDNLGDWEAEENRVKTIKNLNLQPLPFDHEIRLNRISFSYPGGDVPVITEQTFVIRKNTTVGLVGPTGCGKTTTVDILLVLLEPQSGTFMVDGVEITEENVGSWRLQIGYVPQHIYLADDSVAKNIAFGVPEKFIDMEAVEKAARIANVHDFISEEMPAKYETVVGERGIRLSGGQVQRIGIARALYHNPAVLVLDEATSFLDGLTEAAIMDAIHALSHKKTIIMIAHRLATVRECDEIFSMDHGVVVDKGTYQDLVERNERFRKIAQLS
jgi:ABC-type multidrug transport system fused ATPase/permease subunit